LIAFTVVCVWLLDFGCYVCVGWLVAFGYVALVVWLLLLLLFVTFHTLLLFDFDCRCAVVTVGFWLGWLLRCFGWFTLLLRCCCIWWVDFGCDLLLLPTVVVDCYVVVDLLRLRWLRCTHTHVYVTVDLVVVVVTVCRC